jgi:2-phospho-L-lactate/phosphoenolpyruvate guanylyltransferase
MIRTWVIIPVKPLNRAKSRLSTVLSPEQRAHFAEMMYRQVLGVVSQIKTLAGVLVISRDSRALALARESGARTLQESTKSDLNPALQRATEMVRLWRGEAVLILPADLPFVSVNDVQHMLDMAKADPGVVIATDRDKDGTNAMLVRPPSLFEYRYGDNSFVRHVALAREKGASVSIYASDTISLDIDVPADLATYNQMVQSGLYSSLLTPFLPTP